MMKLALLNQVRCSSSSIMVPVKDALELKNIGKFLKICGWVKSARHQKVNTFIDVDDGLTIGGRKIQVVIDSDQVPDNLKYHSAIEIEGILRKSTHPAQEVELEAQTIKIVSPIQNENYPFQPRKRYDDDFTRTFPFFRAKLNDFASLLRIRSGISHAIHDYFRHHNFVQIHTPIITSNDCEGAGEVFQVTPSNESVAQKMQKESIKDIKEAYFDTKAYMTVSGQLHLEAICNGLAKVYTFGPAFRAEMGKTHRHLSEFSMIEAEASFMDDIKDLLHLQENLIKNSIISIMDSHEQDIFNFINLQSGRSVKQKKSRTTCKNENATGSNKLNHIETILNNDFKIMSYDEAFDIVENSSSYTSFKVKPNRAEGLGKEHELYLVENHCNNIPVFIIDWPKSIKSFYARRSLSNSEQVLACDLLFPSVGELCGGSLREHNYDILKSNISAEDLGGEGRLEWYLDLRSSGAAPMGGFGLGFERLIQFLLKVNNIRDTIPFSRSPHNCKM